jgi:hypothetical protein
MKAYGDTEVVASRASAAWLTDSAMYADDIRDHCKIPV